MRVEKEIKVPAKVVKTPAKVKTVTRVTCDFCGKTVDLSKDNRYGSGMSKCSLCHRDICRTTKNGSHYGTPTCFVYDTYDDYGDCTPDKYCSICAPLYLPAREAMKERHWQEEEDLENNLRKESLSKEITHE